MVIYHNFHKKYESSEDKIQPDRSKCLKQLLAQSKNLQKIFFLRRRHNTPLETDLKYFSGPIFLKTNATLKYEEVADTFWAQNVIFTSYAKFRPKISKNQNFF